jgi:hypothetical protein
MVRGCGFGSPAGGPVATVQTPRPAGPAQQRVTGRAWRRWENGAALAHRGDFVGAEAGVHGAAGHLHEHQDIGLYVVAEAASGDGADVAGGDR